MSEIQGLGEIYIGGTLVYIIICQFNFKNN